MATPNYAEEAHGIDAAYDAIVKVETNPAVVEHLTEEEMKTYISAREAWSVKKSTLLLTAINTAGQVPIAVSWGETGGIANLCGT